MKQHRIKELLTTAADVLFVLLLCFAVLLTTMLITTSGEPAQQTAYHVNFLLLGGVVLSIGVYLLYMLRHSLGALKKMISQFSELEQGTRQKGA